MKLYVDEVSIWDILAILIRMPKYLLDVIKEEMFWFTKLAKFEISYPVDWQKLCEKGLAESRHRMKHYQNAQNQNLTGSRLK